MYEKFVLKATHLQSYGSGKTIPWLDTGIDVTAGQWLYFGAAGLTNAFSSGNWDKWTRPNGDDDAHSVTPLDSNFLRMALIGCITDREAPGTRTSSGTFTYYPESISFLVGERYAGQMPSTGRLFLAVNDVGIVIPSWVQDNRGSYTVLIADTPVNPPEHDYSYLDNCPICFNSGGVGIPYTNQPLNLYTGEKEESVTDIVINSPADTLILKRSFRQSKLDSFADVLGLGWTHNQHLYLDDSVTNKLLLTMPGGGVAHFSLRTGTSDQYDGDPGSSSTIDASGSGNSTYTLTASDQSQLIFDADKKLREKQFANGEIWTYTYDTTPRLTEILDGSYGRKLIFRYYTSGDHIGQIRFVGDQTFDDSVDPDNPTGRFVTYTYAQEMLDGVVVANARSVLSSVTDVRGYTWSYTYYGQQVGEDQVELANYLLKITSPSTDLDGDGLSDDSVILKNLSYTVASGEITGIQQQRGKVSGSGNYLETTQYNFDRTAGVTTETRAQRDTKHYFSPAGLHYGSANPATGDNTLMPTQGINANYRPEGQSDANGNITLLEWDASNGGKTLNKVTDAAGHETAFSYDSEDRLQTATDAEGRITHYSYDDLDAPRKPSKIEVLDSDGTTLLSQQEFDYDTQGRVIEERRIDPNKDETEDGYVLQKIARSYHTSGNGNGLLAQITQVDLLNTSNNQSTQYSYDSAGRVIKTQKSSTFGSCNISFTVYDAAGNVVASICNYENAGAEPTTAAEAVALYDPMEPDKNRVTVHEYDALGRKVLTTTDAGSTSYARSTLTLYDALDRVWRTVSNYDTQHSYTAPGTWTWDASSEQWQDASATPVAISHGVEYNENLITDTLYNARGLVRLQRDVKGNVTLFGYDDADRLVKTIRNALNADYDNDYVSGDADLSVYNSISSAADEDIITEQLYDATGNLVKSVDALGTINFTGYDALNRPEHVVNSASYTSYEIEKYYSGFVAYQFSTASDQDLQQTTSYDAMGRVVQTGQLLSGADGTAEWIYSRNVYDAQGRMKMTIRNYVEQLEGPELWSWHEGDARWQLSDGSVVDHGVNNDQNLISETVYDAAGRVQYTRDMAGTRNWQSYDGLGRQFKQVSNSTYDSNDEQATPPNDPHYAGESDNPAADIITESYFDADGRVYKTRRLQGYDPATDSLQWVYSLTGFDTLGRQVKTIQNASQPNYVVGGDESLSNYVVSSNTDEDIVSETAYDAEGRAYKTTDTHGRVTLLGFDSSGRQVKTIQNASNPTYDVTSDPDLSAYTVSGNADEDLITSTAYDILGRVVKTTDAEGNVTLSGYDRAGRRVKTIRNAGNESYAWSTDSDLSSYTADAGATGDQDRVTLTEYDKAGRTVRSTNAQGNVTLTGYDLAGRVVKTIQNASNASYDVLADPDLSAYTPDTGASADQDRTTTSTYDKSGRVITSTDASAVTTYHVYDGLSRRIRSVSAYVPQASSNPADWIWHDEHQEWQDGVGNAIDQGTQFDQNRISDTQYDLLGRVALTRDTRGTLTTFEYDALGRRVLISEAVGTELEASHYTCYDKAGRRERVIQNWLDSGVLPDEKDSNGNWLFNPTKHGARNDRNLITQYSYDKLNRVVSMSDPAGNSTSTTYFRDGQIDTQTDAEGTVTLYRYDGMRRRNRVVQAYVSNGEDPSLWSWNGSNWQESDSTAIDHGTDNDQNIIVDITLDKAGRMTAMRNPLGNLTTYTYDKLGRRTNLTNPLSIAWNTSYEDVSGGTTRVTSTYPGLETGGSYDVQRDFDRLGRPSAVDYGDGLSTPRIDFAYDSAGNRASMTEYNQNDQQIRQTDYTYDTAHRLTQVDFDNDSVVYSYDIAGKRTSMTLPGNQTINYTYNARGQLTSLTDWQGQTSSFYYDAMNRHIATKRPNGMHSDYQHNPAGHLMSLRHFWHSQGNPLAQYHYTLDARGNRTQVREYGIDSTMLIATYDKDVTEVDYTSGTWSDESGFKRSEQFSAKLKVSMTGERGVLTMGTGPDHSLIDVYIDGSLWQSYDCYSETVSERDITLPEGTLLEIRNRTARNLQSSGTVIRFKQLATYSLSFAETVIDYTYDALSRLLQADYDNGTTVYNYGYDVAGNLVNNNGTTRTYNAANQMTHDGTNTLTYDSNGNLTNDGVNAYTWDRANRMLTAPGSTSYKYDGASNRIQQTVSSVVTDYLNDVQPELTKLLAQTTGANTERFVHSVRGIHAVEDSSSDWNFFAQDGLGSIRALVDDVAVLQSSMNYDPVGNPMGSYGAGFRFTGEQRDTNGLQYHRARYYSPELGVWLSEDVLETSNRYSYVDGDPVNRTDASGKCWSNSGATASQQSQCYDAWQGYMNVITDTYTSNWPYDVRRLVTQEASYWSQLTYPEFVTQWNGSRPPNQTNPGQSLQDSATFLGGVAAWNGPTPEDWLWIIGGVCLLAAAAAAQAGSVSLPGRPSYNFAESQDQSDTDDDAIPIPYVGPQDPPDDVNKLLLFHYTHSNKISTIIASGVLYPSLQANGDAQWGDGQYFTDLTPDESKSFTMKQHSYALFKVPWKWKNNEVGWIEFIIDRDIVDRTSSLYGQRAPHRSIFLHQSSTNLPLNSIYVRHGTVYLQ